MKSFSFEFSVLLVEVLPVESTVSTLGSSKSPSRFPQTADDLADREIPCPRNEN